MLSRLATSARNTMDGSALERAMGHVIARDTALPSAILPGCSSITRHGEGGRVAGAACSYFMDGICSADAVGAEADVTGWVEGHLDDVYEPCSNRPEPQRGFVSVAIRRVRSGSWSSKLVRCARPRRPPR